LVSLIQRSNAILKTAIPASAARLGGWVSDAAPAQRVGERRGKRSELDQLAFLKHWVLGNDGLALSGAFAALLE
jgi:hypothetical protein